MLCLSGFEQHSRWVPLMVNHEICVSSHKERDISQLTKMVTCEISVPSYKQRHFAVNEKWLTTRFVFLHVNREIFHNFYRISNQKNFIPKYLDNALTDFA